MKVAIYCRLSEEDRNKQFETDDSNSIQNQKAMLLQYAMEQGWELYNIYSDDDYTGSDRRRPEFNRLLKDAEHTDLILSSAKPSRDLPANWNLWKSTYMVCSPSGVFALSVLLIMQIPPTRETKSPARLTGLSMNGTWRICPKISAAS